MSNRSGLDSIWITYIGLVVIAWEAAAVRSPALRLTAGTSWVVRDATVWLAGAVLVAAFATQLYVVRLQTIHEMLPRPMPIQAYVGGTVNPSVHGAYSAVALLAALFEVLSLAVIAARVRAPLTPSVRVLIATTGMLLAVLAISLPALATTDPYEYVEAARLGFAAYHPPPGSAIRGLIYGPLWLVIAQLVTSPVQGIVAKIVALRVFDAALIVLCARLLKATGAGLPAQIALLLNPAVWFETVANVHNDLWSLAFILAAYALAKRPWWIAALLLGLAGAIKLPFLILGAPAVYPIAQRRYRISAWLGALVLALAISTLGGKWYFAALGGYSANRVTFSPGLQRDVRLALELLVAALAVGGILFGKAPRGMAWLAAQLAPLPFPWYALWGLPFALGSDRWLIAFLLSLPLVMVLMDYNYALHTSAWLVVVAAALFLGARMAAVNLVPRKS